MKAIDALVSLFHSVIIIIIIISVMQFGHLLTRSGLTYPEVSSKVYHDSFCQLDSSVSLPWVIYFEAFYLHVVSSFSCIPVMPVQRLKLAMLPLDLPCSEPVTHSGEILTTGKSHGKQPDRFSLLRHLVDNLQTVH